MLAREESAVPSWSAEFFYGVRLLLRGAGQMWHRPALALLGMVPPLFVSAVMIVLLILLGLYGLTPLTDSATAWIPDSVRVAARIFLGIVIMAVAIVIAVITFAAITVAVGSPIYARISIAIEAQIGHLRPQEVPESWLAGTWRSVRQSLAVIVLSALCSIPVFVVGLIPVLGALLSVIAGAIVGSYLLTLEVISGPFDRWSKRTLGDKIRAVNSSRARSLGFGIPVFMMFLVPMAAVIVFPAVTAGATLLAHELQGGADTT